MDSVVEPGNGGEIVRAELQEWPSYWAWFPLLLRIPPSNRLLTAQIRRQPNIDN
jgi:hypothetical protein